MGMIQATSVSSHPSLEKPSPTVLLADDDHSFIASLEDALSNEPYHSIFARDGAEAQAILAQRDVDLVVTDIRMPEVDGVSLVAELSRRRRQVPCIVMTAFGTPELETRLDRMGIIGFIDKPLDVRELRQRIAEGLEQSAKASLVRGLAVSSFLQLLAMEKKTCTLRIEQNGQVGLLFVYEGDIHDASLGDLLGRAAALELVTWDHAELWIDHHCRIRHKNIDDSMEGILLEAMRLKDEMTVTNQGNDTAKESRDSTATIHEQALQSERETTMSLETHLQELKSVNGYLASGIMDFTGETLVADSVSTSVDLEVTGAVFNDIFRAAHEASGKIGLDACKKMVITTPKGVVVMECSGVDASSHLHFIVVLSEDGNQALARKTLEKVVPKVVSAMS